MPVKLKVPKKPKKPKASKKPKAKKVPKAPTVIDMFKYQINAQENPRAQEQLTGALIDAIMRAQTIPVIQPEVIPRAIPRVNVVDEIPPPTPDRSRPSPGLFGETNRPLASKTGRGRLSGIPQPRIPGDPRSLKDGYILSPVSGYPIKIRGETYDALIFQGKYYEVSYGILKPVKKI